MLVREIMTAPALSAHEDDDLDGALQLLAEHRITALPIVDDAGHVIGVLSEIDVLRRAIEADTRAHQGPVAPSEPLPRTLAEIMTRDPRTTTEGADVADLIELFTTTSFKSLPVVRDGLLVGVVSRSDVVRALWRPDEEMQDELVSAFHDYGQDQWEITVTHGVATIAGGGSAMERDAAAAIARSVLGVRRVHVIENASD